MGPASGFDNDCYVKLTHNQTAVDIGLDIGLKPEFLDKIILGIGAQGHP